MPQISFGQNLPSGGGKFISLENQGESVTFRLAKEPHFEYIHWIETPDGKTEKVMCDRLNNPEAGLECASCESGDKPKAKFYYPILNRDTGKATIFRTSASVHIAIDNEFRDGVDVFKHDYKVTRVGGKDPNKYYRVTRLPEVIDLTDDDKVELAKAKKFDVAEMTGAGRKSSVKEEDDFDIPEEDFEAEMNKLNKHDEPVGDSE